MSIEFRDASPEVREFFDGIDLNEVTCIEARTVALDVKLIVDADGREFVPVVRCKDCATFVRDATPHDDDLPHFCSELGIDLRGDDGFCMWGVRRVDV